MIGVQKGGTTTLQAYLSQHPLIKLPEDEVHFFDKRFHLGKDWYERQFPKRVNAKCLIGEKTPYYIFHPAVPKRVFSLYPKVKIIVLLRNLVDRAYSHYWHTMSNNLQSLSFEQAIKAEFSRIKGEREKLKKYPHYKSLNYQRHSYLARGIYVDQIRSWLKFFPKEQILFLSSEELFTHPEMTLGKICVFLGLPNHAHYSPEHRQKQTRSTMNSKTRKQLAAYFLPYNKELEELLNMKFNWNESENEIENK